MEEPRGRWQERAQTPGAIGYVNQAYVRGPIRAAALQNREGRFVMVDARSGSNCNPAGADSFPIVSFTWIRPTSRARGGEKAAAVLAFLDLALTEAPQRQASELGFLPLQGEVLSKARAAIASIRD
jgi:phosphate transport system substrate-binding protein